MIRPKRLEVMTEHELQQLAEQQLAELKRTLDMLDRVRAQRQVSNLTPQQRRRRMRVVDGAS